MQIIGKLYIEDNSADKTQNLQKILSPALDAIRENFHDSTFKTSALCELCDMSELFARIKAVLRRCNTHDDPDDDEVIKFENIEISLQKYELKLNGKAVEIPPKELELLYFLASHCNKVFTRDQLLDKVWGFDYLGDSRTVDVHVKRLREKLEGVSDKWLLKTVWGVGYKFELIQ